MKLLISSLLVLASLTTAFTVGTVARAHQPGTPWIGAQAQTVIHAATQLQPAALSAAVTGTPAQDHAACVAVYHYHHVAAQYHGDSDTWVAMANQAWLHAWHLAGYADTLPGDSMRYNIRHYLTTSRGWSLVAYDCNPDA